jgi:Leucine-rich repeat (LRR) protein
MGASTESDGRSRRAPRVRWATALSLLICIVMLALPSVAAATTYTITVTASAHGTVSPVGVVTVPAGGDQTITITPDARYHSYVTPDSAIWHFIGMTSYKFTNVTANHTLDVRFDPNPPVAFQFPDANLQAAVARQLGKQPDQVTDWDVAGLTTLDARNCGIQSLAGLENAANMRVLWLDGNQVSDLTPIADMNLSTLWLSGNSISDISALANMNELFWLELSGNPVSDLSVISNKTAITKLGISSISNCDLAQIAGLTSLQKLSVAGNNLTGLGPIPTFTQLSQLDLSSNHLTDITALGPIVSQLNSLSVDNNDLTDISVLSGMRGQTFLFVRFNDLDLTPGSAAMTTITALQAKVVFVTYSPQNPQ